jgi:hypothetical protein
VRDSGPAGLACGLVDEDRPRMRLEDWGAEVSGTSGTWDLMYFGWSRLWSTGPTCLFLHTSLLSRAVA